ncbi:uncharacterized protein Z518_01538 [Rhinocladiella mackenziei CBS 650.93]|uniref:Rhinocladiella mackenziei CBS 650.93 unplaced genomic scaffold supercont1.1, whole genome shotgun sequence n=1 Tax=Rhinocladiella mackenziei CBS 650.93 TaxID=1442369 RepID=A0A0D2JLW4_9EURO|nr:uncharacterized protein Z518_01538 [Rhinocladiella mackenziei CBS 650.93]KIX10455.1 hypothetical protein Z518_01538 [Rhinocladiella mackenziei CBS 650.93]
MLTKTYGAVVVGGGGAGIAAVGALLHFHKAMPIAWIDPDFIGGRISKRYRDVSSNTKTSWFLEYARAFEPFRQVVSSTPKPNAISVLEELNQNRGCRLAYAADMLEMLTRGLLRFPNIDAWSGRVAQADFKNTSSLWSLHLGSADTPFKQRIRSRSLVVCTGSSPTTISLPTSSICLDLDVVLDRRKLRSSLPATDKDVVVGVIGTSHSAIVAIMNLYELATGTHPCLRIKWFARGALSYAVEMDGWILRDNTGLKGASADFAREHLEEDKLSHSPVGRYVTKIQCPDAANESMRPQLSTCTRIVQAIGFTRDPLPRLTLDGNELKGITHDPVTGLLKDDKGRNIPHLYGAGIAFPERVTDPAGNTEMAVGLWKFIKYLNRVAPSWC